ncbi:MAG: ketoacyl-ACP synthase III [Endomicrobium sp.]|jgi:3-oxoacyl-[acyl-carrier-protein] synthase-3|nr:ketoacyl-ACP synthase III [Endomicrobium sp.]
MIGIKAIEYYLPNNTLTNERLEEIFPPLTAERIFKATGVETRHIADDREYVSDMAVNAANKLLTVHNIPKESIDFILLATQSSDYLFPSTACLVQEKAGFSKNIGALDFNLACSGYIYGLSLAKSLVLSKAAKNVLLITADTLSKFIHNQDRSNRLVFSDGASASLICECANNINEFDFGTDGSGAQNLYVPAGGFRLPKTDKTAIAETDDTGSRRSKNNLYMNGMAIFNFAIDIVPKTVNQALRKNNLSMKDIALIVPHQANGFILKHLQRKLNIPDEKFYFCLKDYGNTGSSSIPIALKNAQIENRIKIGNNILLVGFGAGYSWGSIVIKY